MTAIDSSVVNSFAPTGTLRASINVGNAVLARRDAADGAAGVSVDLARAFAERLGVPVSLSVFDTAAESVAAVREDKADIGFFAIDPLRGEGVSFTPPYVLIEGAYLVQAYSPLQHNDGVDAAGIRIAVGKGSAYDLYLSRAITHATLVRAASSQEVVNTFLTDGLEVAAGVKQQLEADMRSRPGLRLLPGRFMVIRQAMGCPRARGPQAQQVLSDFVEQMKADGFVAAALARHGIEGAAVAPAGD